MNIIPTPLALERLDSELLDQANAIQDAGAFEKKITRTRTTLLYKQTKFNLMREESEGYSRLCVDLLEHLVQPLDYYWSSGAETRGEKVADSRRTWVLNSKTPGAHRLLDWSHGREY